MSTVFTTEFFEYKVVSVVLPEVDSETQAL